MKMFTKTAIIALVFLVSFQITQVAFSQGGGLSGGASGVDIGGAAGPSSTGGGVGSNKYTSTTKYFKSFGGKVVSIATNSGSIVCTGTGKLIFLSSNVAGLTKVATSQAEPKGYSKTSGTAQGIYESIPYYTNNVLKEPKVGGWILGKAKATPDLSICYLNLGEVQIPIPVLVTEKYNVSKKIK